MKSKFIIHTCEYPYSVGWAITNKCNLRCIHCNMNSGKELDDELKTDECIKIIDELAKNRVQRITFFGGEPLVRKDFFEIANYAYNKGIFISMTTNALLITEEMIKKELYKFDMIRVSLDGPNEETHEFIRNRKGIFYSTINKIKMLVNNGIDVGVVTCISHRNLKYIDEMIKLLEELKVKRWFLPLLSSAGRGSDISEEVLTPLEVKQFLIDIQAKTKTSSFIVNLDIPYNVLLKKQNKNIIAACPAAISELVIFANGDISPCCQVPVIAGNILKNDIYYIWNNSKIFNDFRNKSLVKGKCCNCKYLMNCGGCRANAYIKYNDYLEGDDVCWK